MILLFFNNNNPIFGPYLSTAKAIDTEAATWILGKECPVFLLPSIGLKSYFSVGLLRSIITLRINVIQTTHIGSAAKISKLLGRFRYILSKNNK